MHRALWVLAASATPSPAAGQPAKERVTALKLFKYVEEKVDKWAQTNRARSQTPVMFGRCSVNDFPRPFEQALDALP